jgi:hypothetical protein
MGKCNLHTSGAILEGNATVGDVLKGKTFYNTDAMEIQTGTLALSGDASASNVLSAKTFYNTDAKTKVTGTMTNRGAVSASVAVGGSYTIQAGYHNGSGKVSGPTLSGTASASDVVSGKTFYSNSGTKQTGTLTSYYPSTNLLMSQFSLSQDSNQNNLNTTNLKLPTLGYGYLGLNISQLPDYNSQATITIKNSSGTTITSKKSTGNLTCALSGDTFTIYIHSVHIGSSATILKNIVLGKTLNDVNSYLSSH